VKFRESRRSQRRLESARLLDCEGSTGAVAGAKRKGIARVQLADGSIHLAEIHWYEAAGIGRKEFKIKHLL